MPKEEIITRFNLLNGNITQQLADRPTIGYFKKVIAASDSKIEAFGLQVESKVQ